MSTTNNICEHRGQAIAHLQGSVSRIDEHTYKVKSQSDNAKEYEIISSELGWQCSCPDFVYRHVKCKHVFAVEFSLELRKKVEITKIEPITNTTVYMRRHRVGKDMFCDSF